MIENIHCLSELNAALDDETFSAFLDNPGLAKILKSNLEDLTYAFNKFTRFEQTLKMQYKLSNMEINVLHLKVRQFDNKHIAEKLCVAPQTVANALHRAKMAIGATSISEISSLYTEIRAY